MIEAIVANLINIEPTNTFAVLGIIVSILRNKKTIINKVEWAANKLMALANYCFRLVVMLLAVVSSTASSVSAESVVSLYNSAIEINRAIERFALYFLSDKDKRKDVVGFLFFVAIKKVFQSLAQNIKYAFSSIYSFFENVERTCIGIAPVMLQ